MKYNIKFEWVFVIVILLSLLSIYFTTTNDDIRLPIVMAIVAAFSGGVGYIFGKSQPDRIDNNQN